MASETTIPDLLRQLYALREAPAPPFAGQTAAVQVDSAPTPIFAGHARRAYLLVLNPADADDAAAAVILHVGSQDAADAVTLAPGASYELAPAPGVWHTGPVFGSYPGPGSARLLALEVVAG